MSRDGLYANREVRTFHCELATQVTRQHGTRCPCCASPMFRPRRNNDANRRRRDKITVAHDKPVSFGGNPEIWVYTCNGCNQDQKAMTFRQWAEWLTRQGDKRAERVAALADTVEAYTRGRHAPRAISQPVPATASPASDAAE